MGPTVTSGPALGADAAAWDRVVAAQPLPSPFLRSWWLGATAGHEPCFVLARAGDELLGGVALEVDRRLRIPRYLALGSTLGPDHLDLVAAPGREEEVVTALAGWFAGLGSSSVEMACLAGPAPLLARAVGGARCDVVEGAPWTPLSPDFDAYLASRPSGLAKRVRRARKALAGEGVVHHRAAPGDVERSLVALRRLHGEVFGEDSLFLPYFDRFAAAARLGVGTGELVFHELRAGDEIVAVDVVFELGGRVSTYQGGRDTHARFRGGGLVLQAAFLEQACADGFTEFDHLRGVTEYKRGWCDEVRPLVRLRATTGLLGRAVQAAVRVATDPRVVRRLRRS